MRVTRLFHDGWFFQKRELFSGHPEASSSLWQPVALPHDWLIGDANRFYDPAEGWYRKEFSWKKEPDHKAFLYFEGVYMDSTIYINGVEAFAWKYGYSSFSFDCTPFLHEGSNEVLVRVIYQTSNSRWYSGAGIYRSVWFISCPDRHIAFDGVYVTPVRQSDDGWAVEVDTELSSLDGEGLVVRHAVRDAEGTLVAQGEGGCTQTLLVEQPRLWRLDAPALYTLTTSLYQDDRLLDEVSTRFGFRTIAYDPADGFSLNGERIKLQGACEHHDLGCLGAAVNRSALERQLRILREMGVNAIRTAHNMPAVELMELADEMGFLICTEAFDMWEKPKNPYDYARFFPEWAERDVASWVRRDRNHPSLIMWCVGNEVYEMHEGVRGQELTQWLMEQVYRHDPKRHAPVTTASNYIPWENAQRCGDIVKLVGYNYADKYYEPHHEKYPDWIIYGSETCSTVQSRGIYHFPQSQSLLADDDEQCSSLGNSSTSWGAKNTESCILSDYRAPFSAGQFIWSGFDYIGEPTPYHTKNSYFGQIDTAGFPKDAFYVYQAAWTSAGEKPMVHLFPYWDFSEGQAIDVQVCSNTDSVELFLNGQSQGRTALGLDRGRLLAHYSLRYTPGELRAVAYDASGNIVAEQKRCSFGDAAKLQVQADRTSVRADGKELSFLTITALDAEGHEVENAVSRVHVAVEGAGRLAGLDNGDSTDYESYQGSSKRMFSGKLLAVVAPDTVPGTITVTVTSPGLEPASVTIDAVSCHLAEGSGDPYAPPVDTEIPEEIPIRKIALTCMGSTELHPDHPTLTVQAVIQPANASYHDLIWKLTDRAGIPSSLATLEAKEDTATITALGDGEVWLRCMSKNGRDKVSLISQMSLTVTGMGEVCINPYDFVYGGQWTTSNVDLTNGNERGVATLREAVSYVGFQKIDFGAFGSDRITLWAFPMTDVPLPIEIWEGMPDEAGSEQLCTVMYTTPSEWNVYHEESYTLPRRLHGIKTLCFVFSDKVHLKGFEMEKQEKAFAKLKASEHTYLYGDSFVRDGDAVCEIGNNVTFGYADMHFESRLPGHITICGRTPLDRNTIHIHLRHGEEDEVVLVEFPHAEEYTAHTFPIPAIGGADSVELVFLPGSRFDLQWFQFE